MKGVLIALIVGSSFALSSCAAAEESPAETIALKDGSTLYLHPDGTSRMIDVHGKRMTMKDGAEMETADGRTIVMMNKKVWVEYGPSGKGGKVLKTD